MTKIAFTDRDGNEQITKGSDGRLDTSSRSDGRAYYNSRDERRAFSLIWDDASSEAGDYILYWKNTDTNSRHLVIDAVGINSVLLADFELQQVTGTVAGGVATPPVCLNRASPIDAPADAFTADTTPLTGLTSTVIIDVAQVDAGGHQELRMQDRLRIGQGSAIAIRCKTAAATTRTFGVVYAYYE